MNDKNLKDTAEYVLSGQLSEDYNAEKTFIKEQQELARETAQRERLGSYDPQVLNTLIQQIITNTINHLLAELEDRSAKEQSDQFGESEGWLAIGFNQANAKIRQLGADIISEVS